MAISKVILNGTTLMDVTTDTVAADKLLSSYTATKNDGTKITGTLQSSSLKTAQGYSAYNSNSGLWTLTFTGLTNSPHTFFLTPNTPNINAGYIYGESPFYGVWMYTQNGASTGVFAYSPIVNGSYDGTNSMFYTVASNMYVRVIDEDYDPIVNWSYSNGTLTMTCPNIANVQSDNASLYLWFISIGQLEDGTTPPDYILYYT